jgi:hypothetical protein
MVNFNLKIKFKPLFPFQHKDIRFLNVFMCVNDILERKKKGFQDPKIRI